MLLLNQASQGRMTTQVDALERRRAKYSPMKGLSCGIMLHGSTAKTRIDNADRISALPEPLLQHIMLFLPCKDAVRTCILSKIWEKSWRTFPVLNFDENLFERESREMIDARDDVQKFNRARGRLLNYWKQALESHRHHCSSNTLSIEKLTFKASFLDDSEFAERCLCYAIESNVKELELDISLSGDRLYHLTQVVFCSESLNVLELFRCKLLEFPLHNSVKLPSLRKLKLARVHASDQVIENLVAGCPLIEDLNFEFCKGFKSIKLLGHSKLADIKVKDDGELEEVDINALNAHSISVAGPVPSGKINVVACENLKSLFLCMISVVDESLSYHITRLAVLECLGLINCFKLRNIKISSPSLKRLEIYRCTKLAAVEIETPNLCKYTYTGDIVPFSSSTALKLLETNLNLYTRNCDPQWYVKFIDLTAKFHQWSKVLNLLSDSGGESVIVPKELRQILRPPLSGVKHLNFSISVPGKSFAIAQIVDGLLWMSPHVDTLTIDYGHTFKKFCFKISYKDEVVSGGVETAHCCKSVPVLCWGHCIRKIEVEMISKDKNFNSARMVFEDEDILKKINGLGDLILKNKTFRWIYED